MWEQGVNEQAEAGDEGMPGRGYKGEDMDGFEGGCEANQDSAERAEGATCIQWRKPELKTTATSAMLRQVMVSCSEKKRLSTSSALAARRPRRSVISMMSVRFTESAPAKMPSGYIQNGLNDASGARQLDDGSCSRSNASTSITDWIEGGHSRSRAPKIAVVCNWLMMIAARFRIA